MKICHEYRAMHGKFDVMALRLMVILMLEKILLRGILLVRELKVLLMRF